MDSTHRWWIHRTSQLLLRWRCLLPSGHWHRSPSSHEWRQRSASGPLDPHIYPETVMRGAVVDERWHTGWAIKDTAAYTHAVDGCMQKVKGGNQPPPDMFLLTDLFTPRLSPWNEANFWCSLILPVTTHSLQPNTFTSTLSTKTESK